MCRVLNVPAVFVGVVGQSWGGGGGQLCVVVCVCRSGCRPWRRGGGVLSRSDTLAGHVVELKYYLSGININYRLYLHSAHF